MRTLVWFRGKDLRLSDHAPLAAAASAGEVVPLFVLDPFFFEPEFRPHFERGADVLLGHQALRAKGEPGFVAEDGSLVGPDPAADLARVATAGLVLREAARAKRGAS